MKVVLIVIVVAAAGWFLYGRTRGQAPAAAPAPNAVERYGQNLATGVQRADAVRDKANAAIRRAEDAQKALQQAESQ